MMGSPNRALRRDADRIEEKNRPIRKAVGDLLGLGIATVGRVPQGPNQQGGVVVSALPHGPQSAPRER